MAANRNVELIVRARDEASKALNSIAAELDALVNKQTGAARSGSEFGASLAQMVAQMAQFEKVSGLVAGAADRAEAAIQRTQNSIQGNGQALAAVVAQIANARQAIARIETGIVDTRLGGGDSSEQVAQLAAAKLGLADLESQQRRLQATVASGQQTLADQQRGFAELASMVNSAHAAVASFGDAEARAALQTQAATESQRQAADAAASADRMSRARGSFVGPTDNGTTPTRAADTALADLLRQEDAAAKAADAEAVAIQRVIDKTNPLAQVQRQLAADLELARKGMQRGIITAEEYAAAEAKLAQQAKDAEEALARTGRGQSGVRGPFGLKPYELTNLGYQVNDVFTQLASGTPVMQVIAQQGGQVLQLVPNIGSALTKAFSNPYFLGAAAIIGGITVSLKRAADNSDRLQQIQAIVLQMGQGAGATAKELDGIATSLEHIGIKTKDALALMRDFAGQGLNPAFLQVFAEAARDTAQVTGQDLKTSAEELRGAFTKGYESVAALDDKMQFLTKSEREQIRAMFESGQASAAQTRALQLYHQRVAEIADKSRGEWSKAFDALGNSVDRLIDRFAKTDTIKNFAASIEGAASRIANALTGIDDKSLAQIDARIAEIQKSFRDAEASPLGGLAAAGAHRMFDDELAALQKRRADIVARQQASNAALVNQEAAANQKRISDAMALQNEEERLQQLRDKGQQGLTKAETTERARLAGAQAYRQEIEKTGLVEIAQAKQRQAIEHETAQILQQNKAAREREISQFESRVIGAEGGAAKNPNSSAQGFGQFINSTYIDQFRKVFPELAKTMSEAAILATRKWETTAKAIIDNYARENARFLEQHGKQITAANLYLTHFLGPGGALKVLNAAPNTPVDRILGADVMNANKGYLRTDGGRGRARTAAELQAFIAQRIGDTGAAQSAGQAEINKILDEAKIKQQEFNLSIKQANDERQREIDNLTVTNKLQDTKLISAERQQAIDKAEFDLRQQEAQANKGLEADDPRRVKLTDEEIAKTRELAGALFDLQRARESAQAKTTEAERPVNDLSSERDAIQGQIEALRAVGDGAGADALLPKLAGINDQLRQAIDNAIKFYETLDPATDPLHRTREQIDATIARLKTAQIETVNWVHFMGISGETIARTFASNATSAIDKFAQAVANGSNAFSALGDAFLQFASDFLRQIAQMIQQQIIFNLVSGLLKAVGAGAGAPSGGGGGGGIINFGGGPSVIAHSGGVIGQSILNTRPISEAWFAGALRYHTGGVAGLRPDEVPAILQKGEEVLTRTDPRHRANGGMDGGAGGQPKVDLKIVNTFDAGEVVSEGLSTRAGQQSFLNFVRSNKRAFREASS